MGNVENGSITVNLMQDFSEIVPYEQETVPLYIRTTQLSAYADYSAPCHWHEDLEWIYILKGTMYYYVNGSRLLLRENDILMVNARQMHYGYRFKEQDCHFTCILIHPVLFCANEALTQKYVTPVLNNSSLEYVHLSPCQRPWQEASKILTRVAQLKECAADGYELEAAALIQALWSRLWQEKVLVPGSDGQELKGDLKIQKDMVSYIYTHYAEKITLDEIAAAGNVSRSKCCRIFKHYLQQSPVDFLNTCRLKISCRLLDTTDKSITETALACGFHHLSYYSKFFTSTYGCTPREYKNRSRKVP